MGKLENMEEVRVIPLPPICKKENININAHVVFLKNAGNTFITIDDFYSLDPGEIIPLHGIYPAFYTIKGIVSFENKNSQPEQLNRLEILAGLKTGVSYDSCC